MMITKPSLPSLPSVGSLITGARGLFGKTEAVVEVAVELPNPQPIDQKRYERLLDHELDRQLLTEVEQEDSDMLERVRAALYEE